MATSYKDVSSALELIELHLLGEVSPVGSSASHSLSQSLSDSLCSRTSISGSSMVRLALAFLLLVMTVSVDAHGPASSRPNPVTNLSVPPGTKTGQNAVVGHRVAPSLRSPKKASARPPAAPNGHSLDPLLGSMKKGPIPPSTSDPVSNLPGPPHTKTSQSTVAGHRGPPSLGSPKKASSPPPAAPNGDRIPPSSTYP